MPPARQHLLTIAAEDDYPSTPFKRLVDRPNWYRVETHLDRSTLRTVGLIREGRP